MATVELRDIVTDADRAAVLALRVAPGTAALDAVVAYVRGRGARTLLVSAHQADGGPQPFYERYGFVLTGRIVEDEPVSEVALGE